MGYVRSVQDGDIEFVAEHMRAADVEEIYAASGLRPVTALRCSVALSGLCCTIVGNDEAPCAMFGVAPISELEGGVWLLGTDQLTAKGLRRQFLEQGRKYFDLLHTYRPLLCNFVDERNTLHVRWLKWMGCSFVSRDEQYGIEKRPFLEFVRVRNESI